MNKQKHQNLIKRYIAFFTFCIVLILIGVFASIPIEINVTINSVGEKPPFLLAFLFSTSLLSLSVGMGYSAYQYWFEEEKARANVKKSIERLSNHSFIFQLPIYNPTFLFWFLRVTTPVAALMLFGIFLLVAFSAF